MSGHTKGKRVCASQAQSRCFMPVDEPQRKSETFRFRMSMALLDWRGGEMSAATTGVAVSSVPHMGGFDKGC